MHSVQRVTGANCGSAAAQTFSYDPFGNIDKSGSPYSFLPNYSTSTNRMTSIGSSTPTYDNNGNVTNDSFHSYTWDADGHAITVDTSQSDAVTLTYDAMGRMVEQSRSGGYTQIVYAPTGEKLALMTGQTLQKAMVPLSGNALAVYSSSGLQYYAHADLLGSIRLGTTPSRTMYFDVAYAPFGETYAAAGTPDPTYTGQMNDTAHRQDTAGGLYDFPLREYSTQGRWPNPDPLGVSATCPNDPQSQNRYAYVRNNPITHVDPTGGFDFPDDFFGFGGGGGICDPEDPLCDFCLQNPAFCFGPLLPPPFIFGGGGGNPENQRAFPWTGLPPGFFGALDFLRDRLRRCRQQLAFCLAVSEALFKACEGDAGTNFSNCVRNCQSNCPVGPPGETCRKNCYLQGRCRWQNTVDLAGCVIDATGRDILCNLKFDACLIGGP